MSAGAVKHIVIVGGGSAGWLTAGVIAAEHQSATETGLKVTLIESPDVRTVGVGEGTWPSMRETLHRMGVSESEFIRECDASFKQGSKFVNWVTNQPGDYYYHPFVLPAGYTETNLVVPWLARHGNVPFADLVSFQPHLCERGCAPKQASTPEFAAVANYAYHLDAGKFGEFLKRHCVEKLGVRHVLDHVTGISSKENGDIAALNTQQGGNLAADLFIDCTGFAALLIGRHFEIPFVDCQPVLFNNRALAVQVPYPEEQAPIASQTNATAQRGGWIWDIGLPTRRGVGHVYSSTHCSDDEAHAALKAYLQDTAPDVDTGDPRKISFSPGYRKTFWHRNCVAIGISAGFIEPLEASALALIELSAAMLRDDMPATREVMDIVADRFNRRFTYRWERIIDFLKLHYVLSRREDSTFWTDHRDPDTVPDRLLELLRLWRHQPPSRRDLPEAEEVFPSASYQYVLYGMGFRPEQRDTTRASDDYASASRYFSDAALNTRKMLAALPSNRDLLNRVRTNGLPRV
ncbi:MAG: tryptophan halogenase family protein [Pseudomonadota bacterium]